MYRLIVFNILLCSYFGSQAQELLTYSYIDSLTYSQWENKNWKNLINTSKIAERQKLDSYYLRLRTGIAYYELGRYRKAQPYFSEILKNNSADYLAMEYLYFSYLFSGQQMEAKRIKSQFPDVLSKKLGLKKTVISNVYSQVGSLINKPSTHIQNNYNTNAEHVFVSERLKKLNYSSTGLTFNLSPKTNLSVAYTNINTDGIDYIESDTKQEIKSTTKQNQYFIQLKQNLGKGWKLHGALNLLNIKTNNFNHRMDLSYYNNTTHKSYDTTFVSPGGITINQHIEEDITLLDLEKVEFKYNKKLITINKPVFNIGVSKQIGFFDFSADVNIGEINFDKYKSFNIGTIYYPFGNLNSYASINQSYHINKDDWKNTKKTWISSFKVGQKLTKFLWIEGLLRTGDAKNMAFNEGAYILNNMFTETSSSNIKLIIPINKFSFYINYSYTNNLGTEYYFNPNNGETKTYNGFTRREIYKQDGSLLNIHNFPIIGQALDYDTERIEQNNYNFINQIITVGIIWTF